MLTDAAATPHTTREKGWRARIYPGPALCACAARLTVPARVKVAVLSPTRRPFESRRAPPLLPALTLASVCAQGRCACACAFGHARVQAHSWASRRQPGGGGGRGGFGVRTHRHPSLDGLVGGWVGGGATRQASAPGRANGRPGCASLSACIPYLAHASTCAHVGQLHAHAPMHATCMHTCPCRPATPTHPCRPAGRA